MVKAISGGEAIIEAVLHHGVDTVFGLPGAQTYPIFDALHGHANRVRTVSCRHEQGAGYMAFGYAKSTGRPGVYCVVPGPGVLNATAALSTAWACNTPVQRQSVSWTAPARPSDAWAQRRDRSSPSRTTSSTEPTE